MISRLHAAWIALRGRLVPDGHGWVVILVDGRGAMTCRWDGMSRDDENNLLYQAADAMADRMHGNDTVH